MVRGDTLTIHSQITIRSQYTHNKLTVHSRLTIHTHYTHNKLTIHSQYTHNHNNVATQLHYLDCVLNNDPQAAVGSDY